MPGNIPGEQLQQFEDPGTHPHGCEALLSGGLGFRVSGFGFRV